VAERNISDPPTNVDFVAFEPGRPLSEQLQALTRLIKIRKIHAVSKTPEFERWLIHLGETATLRKEPEERLLAVAALTRISATVSALRPQIARTLSAALAETLPPLDMLKNPDDRTYVAKACSIAQAPWCAGYLANAAVVEDSAERTRLECFRSLLKLLPNLQAVLEYLRDHILDFEPAKESPGDSVGRRLRRILAALRRAISSKVVDSGPAPGDVLAEVLRLPFRRHDPPSAYEIIGALADEAGTLVHELIRTRFSLAVDAETYKPLRVVRGWLDYRWSEFVQSSNPLESVRRDLREAITILAKQGKTDNELADALEVVCGSRREARSVMAQIGEETVGIDETVRSWLLNSSTPRLVSEIASESPSYAIESQRLYEASLLAELFLDAADLIKALGVIGQKVTDGPGRAHLEELTDLDSLIAKAGATADVAISFAKRRSLELRGEVGEEVEYSPLEHDLIGGFRTGLRRVRIARPAVAYRSPDSAPIIVKKAVVEPSKS
jgi:hypothetical protein